MTHFRALWLAVVLTPLHAVADVTPSGSDLRSTLQTSHATIGDLIEFQVPGLDAAVQGKLCDPTAWQLLIDDLPLTSPKPLVDLARNTVRFPLVRADADKAVWEKVLGQPPLDGIRDVPVGIRLDATHEMGSSSNTGNRVALRLFSTMRAGLGSLFMIFATGLFVYFARTSDIVRDAVPAQLLAGQRRPYSLARCQMAFWSFLVIGSFLLIWTVTGDYNHIVTQQTFVLFGISCATGLGAVAIDANGAKAQNASPSVHFLDDVLTDANGITVYRFQMLLWTVVLGIVYIVSVYQTLSTPAFDSNLLTLTGISAGTYLGFKIPEKQN